MINRQLGFWMCTALVVGNIIGMGIFMQPAALAPFGLNALTGWAAVIVGCTCLALTFAVLARKLPQADGVFDYVRETQGSAVAFAAMWCYWISCVVTIAGLPIAVVGYFKSAFPVTDAISSPVMTVTFIWLFIGINVLGVKSGGRVQVVTSLLKLMPLGLVMVLGVVSILASPGSYTPNIPTTPIAVHATMAAAAIALFPMQGFESAAVAAGRVTNPEKTIPRATLVGTLFVAAIYVTIVAVGMLLVPQATLAASDAPFVTILDALLGAGSGRWLALFVVISGLGCLNGWTLVVGELGRTFATKRLLPEIFGRTNRFGAPWIGLVVIGAAATFVALMNYSDSLVAGFTFLSVVATAANLPLYFCCALALFVFLRRDPSLSPALWLAGLGGIAFSVFAFLGVGLKPFLWALALAAIGLPVYVGMRKRQPVSAAATPASRAA